MRLRRTWDQLVVVHTAVERRFRKPFGRVVIRLRKYGRDILRGGLILEAVDVIFGWEAIGRTRIVAEQIPDRVVVLAVRQAAKLRPGNLAGARRRRYSSGRQFAY